MLILLKIKVLYGFTLFGQLGNLRRLDLNHNQLTGLPRSIENLRNSLFLLDFTDALTFAFKMPDESQKATMIWHILSC